MAQPDGRSEPFASNAVRLGPGEWLRTAALVIGIAVALPPVWSALETFAPDPDYRIPYALSEDYSLYRRFARRAAASGATLLIGDSVIWGQYVRRDETLSHYLNALSESGRFVNLGLDGTHPLALEGLIRYYGRAIRDADVIVHLNLLWLSSPEADLQAAGEIRFNHPRLVPQFARPIPGYTETVSGRLGIVVERHVRFMQWVRHLQSVSFDQRPLGEWTMENPYADPLARISLRLPAADTHRDPGTRAAPPAGGFRPSLPWVDPETSRQWPAFQRLVGCLEKRENRVFIIVGPLDEHRLSPGDVAVYTRLLGRIEASLQAMNLRYALLPLLDAASYADLSHPTGEGYARLAETITEILRGGESRR